MIIGEEIHEVKYYDGIFTDTACGKRIFGTLGKDYDIVWDREVTCKDCMSSAKS